MKYESAPSTASKAMNTITYSTIVCPHFPECFIKRNNTKKPPRKASEFKAQSTCRTARRNARHFAM